MSTKYKGPKRWVDTVHRRDTESAQGKGGVTCSTLGVTDFLDSGQECRGLSARGLLAPDDGGRRRSRRSRRRRRCRWKLAVLAVLLPPRFQPEGSAAGADVHAASAAAVVGHGGGVGVQVVRVVAEPEVSAEALAGKKEDDRRANCKNYHDYIQGSTYRTVHILYSTCLHL